MANQPDGPDPGAPPGDPPTAHDLERRATEQRHMKRPQGGFVRSEPIQDNKRSDGNANRRQADRPASFEFGLPLELTFAFRFEFSLEFRSQFTPFSFQFSLK
jgi:hypothetical protein